MRLSNKIWILAYAFAVFFSGCAKKKSPGPFHDIQGTYLCRGDIVVHNLYPTYVHTDTAVNTTFYIKVINDTTLECGNPYDTMIVYYQGDDGTKISFLAENDYFDKNYFKNTLVYDYKSIGIFYEHTVHRDSIIRGDRFTSSSLSYRP